MPGAGRSAFPMHSCKHTALGSREKRAVAVLEQPFSAPSLNRLAFGRLVFKGMGISRPDAVIGKCRMIRHSRDRKNEPNPERCVSASRAPSPRRAVSRRERLLAARLWEQPSLSCAESTATLPAG